MARGSNVVTHGLRGNLGRVTFVDSKRYGPHVRSKRGSIKPAPLNDAMEKSSRAMALASAPAKAIFDAVRSCHKDGELWNKLIVIFRRQLRAGRPFHIDAQDFEGMECHEKFTLDQLMRSTDYKISAALQEDNLHVDLSLQEHPDWSYLNWKDPFQYRLSLVTVFPYLKAGGFEREIMHGPVAEFTAPPEPLSFKVPVPGNANGYLLFLLATVCQRGEVVNQTHVRGMGVVGMGTL